MVDLTIPAVPNTEQLSIVLNLSNWASVYTLDTARFLAQVRDYAGGGQLRYEWDTDGAAASPASVTSYESVSGVLILRCPSSDMAAAFPPALVALIGRTAMWELGFYLLEAPDDYIGIGIGKFPVTNGVVN